MPSFSRRVPYLTHRDTSRQLFAKTHPLPKRPAPSPIKRSSKQYLPTSTDVHHQRDASVVATSSLINAVRRSAGSRSKSSAGGSQSARGALVVPAFKRIRLQRDSERFLGVHTNRLQSLFALWLDSAAPTDRVENPAESYISTFS